MTTAQVVDGWLRWSSHLLLPTPCGHQADGERHEKHAESGRPRAGAPASARGARSDAAPPVENGDEKARLVLSQDGRAR
jgi:hypothetical protein